MNGLIICLWSLCGCGGDGAKSELGGLSPPSPHSPPSYLSAHSSCMSDSFSLSNPIPHHLPDLWEGGGSGRTAVWRTIAEPGRGRSSAPPPSNARTRGRALQGCLSVYPMTTKPTQPSTRTEFCPHSSFRAKAEGGAGAGAVEGGREASARWG